MHIRFLNRNEGFTVADILSGRTALDFAEHLDKIAHILKAALRASLVNGAGIAKDPAGVVDPHLVQIF